MEPPLHKIPVIGSPGSGKSTLATQLHEASGLPLVRLDQEYWNSGWVEPPVEEWREHVARLVKRDRWIMEGNYGGTFDLRFPAADLVVLLDVPPWRCLWRVLRRTWKYRGKSRPDMPQDCPERFSWAFYLYILKFRRTRRARILQRMAELREDQLAVVVRDAPEAEKLLQLFINQASATTPPPPGTD